MNPRSHVTGAIFLKCVSLPGQRAQASFEGPRCPSALQVREFASVLPTVLFHHHVPQKDQPGVQRQPSQASRGRSHRAPPWTPPTCLSCPGCGPYIGAQGQEQNPQAGWLPTGQRPGLGYLEPETSSDSADGLPEWGPHAGEGPGRLGGAGLLSAAPLCGPSPSPSPPESRAPWTVNPQEERLLFSTGPLAARARGTAVILQGNGVSLGASEVRMAPPKPSPLTHHVPAVRHGPDAPCVVTFPDDATGRWVQVPLDCGQGPGLRVTPDFLSLII